MEELRTRDVNGTGPTVSKMGSAPETISRFGMFFLLPWTIGFLIFTLYPMAASFIYSFSIYHPKAPLEWNGLKNYHRPLHDDLFWKSLYNTLYMVAIGCRSTTAAVFTCAVLLNLKVRGQSIYRVIYFLPSIVPTVASTILWLWILNPQTGILNTLLGYVGHRRTELDEQPDLVEARSDPARHVGHGRDNCHLPVRLAGCAGLPA